MFRRFNRGLDILIKRLSVSLRYKSALFFIYHSNKEPGLPVSPTGRKSAGFENLSDEFHRYRVCLKAPHASRRANTSKQFYFLTD